MSISDFGIIDIDDPVPYVGDAAPYTVVYPWGYWEIETTNGVKVWVDGPNIEQAIARFKFYTERRDSLSAEGSGTCGTSGPRGDSNTIDTVRRMADLPPMLMATNGFIYNNTRPI